MANERENSRLAWRWRKAAAVAVGIIGMVVIGSFILPAEAQQRDKLGLPLPGAPVEPADPAKMAFPLPDTPSLAVLAFDNLTGDAKQDYFVDGFVDDLITDLSKILSLFVVSRSSSFTYKGKPVKIKQVAEELGVRYVMEGSIRRAGGTIRVNAQLIDALSGNHVWAEKFDGDAADIFALQDKINDKIAAALSLNIGIQQSQEAGRRATNSPEAWEAFRQGLTHINRFTARDNGLANEFFKKALELDPNYAPALGNLAATYSEAARRADPEWWRAVGAETQEEVVAAFEPILARALENPTSSAYRLDARRATRQGEHERALTQAQRAVDLVPWSPGALNELAGILTWAGKSEAGLRRANEARRLHPKWLAPEWNRGLALFSMERYEEAAAALETIAASDAATVLLVATYAQLDRQEEMRAARDRWYKRVQKRFGVEPTISGTMPFFPWARPEDRERLASLFRKAGVPE